MAALDQDTVYLTLESRGVPGTFHWGIFASSLAPGGQYYHATNKSGGWQLEVRPTRDIMSFSMSLVLIYKLGQTSSQSQIDQLLRDLPADGSPSLRTGEGFTCRTWAKDAVMALHNNNLINLTTDIGGFRHLFLLSISLPLPPSFHLPPSISVLPSLSLHIPPSVFTALPLLSSHRLCTPLL